MGSEKLHVLVVDDNAETCTLLTALLQREFVVDVANDGMDAVDKVKTRRYSAILLDLRMPHYDGFSLLDHLKQSQPQALKSVIVVTAAGPREIAKAQEYDLCATVSKPFDVDKLLALVKRCADPEGSAFSTIFCAPIIILLADLIQKKLI